MYLTRSGQNTPLYLHPQHGHSLKTFTWEILLLVHVISFLYNAAILQAEGSKSPTSDFLLIETLRFAKVGKSKQSLFTHDLASLLVYESLDGNTGIMIFMPTSKCSLPVTVAGSCFFLLLIVHLALSNGLNKVRHSLTRLGLHSQKS